MTDAEDLMLWALREWRCLHCETLHRGPPSSGVHWKWCPTCGASSRRTHVVAVSPQEQTFIDRKLREVAQEASQGEAP
jgi:hypothetical protein